MRVLISVTGIASVLSALTGCDNPTASSPEVAPDVDVARPVVRESVEWDEFTGRLGAPETVEVRSRVTGYLDHIHFKPGQIVYKGDLLFTIDPRPFEAALDRAKADVAMSRAELAHAEYDLQRVRDLKSREVAAEKEYQDALYAERRARSDVDGARAQQRIAELNLEWTQVVAPVNGRISREQVTIGNLIQNGAADATLLTTIVSVDPIYCYFDVDEQTYLKYERMALSGERTSSRVQANPVQVALFNDEGFVHPGHMDFVDNAIDPQSGTLRVRALLPNPSGTLLPGLFVRVRLIGSGAQSMVLVPDEAIAADQTTRVVFVVDEHSVARPRRVTVGRVQDGLRRITSGLDGSEIIVVAGVQRVRANMTVRPNLVAIPPDDVTPATTSQPTTAAIVRSKTGAAP